MDIHPIHGPPCSNDGFFKSDFSLRSRCAVIILSCRKPNRAGVVGRIKRVEGLIGYHGTGPEGGALVEEETSRGRHQKHENGIK